MVIKKIINRKRILYFLSWLEIFKLRFRKFKVLRHIVRSNNAWQIGVCGLLGVLVSFVTIFLHSIVLTLHKTGFNLPDGERLSTGQSASIYSIMIMPVLGGIFLGLYIFIARRWKNREIVDPIEANAVYGGKMSSFDSSRLLVSTLISNSSGASIGMEAAYTQVGAGLFSSIGQKLKLRRQDLRIFVAAGAAAAISAAFNAPLAGAFYGFELILGVYSVTALSQVAAASLMAAVVANTFGDDNHIFSVTVPDTIMTNVDYAVFILLGILAALVGIFTMKFVVKCESTLRKIALPDWLYPAFGGFLVALIALLFPQVLGGGQGAIDNHLHDGNWTLILLLGLLFAKITASAISIGSGFRGGLFSSSLLIGCILGEIVSIVASHFFPQMAVHNIDFMLVGMASVAASIIGAPLTMIMLILENTGNFLVTTAVLAGVLVSSAMTRYYFGYSFSTWRFHLKGLKITGAQDIGWAKEITMNKIMNKEIITVSSSSILYDLRKTIPITRTKKVFVVDSHNNYQGMIDAGAIHNHNFDKTAVKLTAADIMHGQNKFLLPNHDIKHAVNYFSDSEMEELPILKSEREHKIVGYVGESQILRLYTQELELHNLERYDALGPLKPNKKQ